MKKFNSLKSMLIDMIQDTSGHINSKIVVGLLSFICGCVGCFTNMPIGSIIALFTYSSSALGWSAFDNKSAIQIVDSKTETITNNKTSETNTTIDVEKIVDNVLKKFNKKKK